MNIAKITDHITLETISLDMKATNKNEALLELSKLLGASNSIEDYTIIELALLNREKLGSTGIGKNVAIPHAKTDHAKNLTIAFGRSNKGVNFNSLDGNSVNLFFAFASPLSESGKYLKILARVSRLIREESFRNRLLKAATHEDILKIISSEES